MGESILLEKAYALALRIVKLSQYRVEEKKEFVLSRKILDSGTGIGALIEEAKQGLDRRDFATGVPQGLPNKHLRQTTGCVCYVTAIILQTPTPNCFSMIASSFRR